MPDFHDAHDVWPQPPEPPDVAPFPLRAFLDRALMHEWPADWVTDDQGEALPPLTGLGWPVPPPKFERNAVWLTMSTDAAVENGLIAPPPGWEPWRPPPVPWHRRLRGRACGAAYDARMRLASALAGFDVTDRGCC